MRSSGHQNPHSRFPGAGWIHSVPKERRSEPEPILSRDELAEYTRRLSILSVPGVEGI
jgi:hypothetical protein